VFRKLIIIITFTSIFIEGLLVAHAQNLNMIIPISMLLLMLVLAYITLTGVFIYLTEKEVVEVVEEINVYEPPIEVVVDRLVEDLFEEKGVAQVDIGMDTSSEDIEIVEPEEDDIIGVIEIGSYPHTGVIETGVVEIDNSLLKEEVIDTDLDIDLEKLILEVEDDPELIEQLRAIDNIGKAPEIEDFNIDDELDDLTELIEKEV